MFAPMNKFIPNLSKLEPLNETKYYRWSQRMIIFFEQLEVDYVLFNPPVAKVVAEAEDSAIVSRDLDFDATTKDKYDKNNKMDTLEKKYGADDARIRSTSLESG
ncbi:hypothetical protein PVK06_008233 [Gossypium arboreum]|uniref:Uncharacterized protein n=1 Tax=Gossypium arboreum TaxID=29729 RepID=A0ABR0QJN3_GOSAR|nr:hypothetical protein PVK06_008233 [Gossypium arboreum]